MKLLIDKLEREHHLSAEEYKALLEGRNEENSQYLFERARAVQKEVFQNHIYIRGLIEFTNFCKNDCYYCGIRNANEHVSRYRLTKEEILSCCEEGYAIGFRTFVLQGGEDVWYTDERLEEIISAMRKKYPDCAITLSVGERSKESYQRLFDAGANRYLLRHETANEEHYKKLHPQSLSLVNRKQCLSWLKEIGYQVGCGFMVGSPYQTLECLVEDLLFLEQFKPQMIGIGPFLSHHQTPFKEKENGSLELTLYLLGILRLMMPKVLLPATTALGTIAPDGREAGILAGANVVMPNLSPQEYRGKYLLYDNKLSTGSEAAEHLQELRKKMERIGYEIVVDRGDYHV